MRKRGLPFSLGCSVIAALGRMLVSDVASQVGGPAMKLNGGRAELTYS